MQVVIETPDYLSDAKAAGLSEEERKAIVDFIAANPDAGVAMKGAGGARKIRFAGRGKGKSGGYRVITFFAGTDIPVFLLAIFSKGEKANLSQSERNELRGILGEIAEIYREGAKQNVRSRK
ncbi:type II toxin-antitoxin system RelE/ParE family toxin [Prosthecochloris vibrioformis]|uniref:Addiction module toxin RelE n=1 Tax=Prosthecochloris vibrioformis TaxID=1098 RepID=A0A5C4RY04_PROVB|nr:type II toxin-antitoxin system RelE/ParE family toxin [Prosthecochloris vibrioformis]TNJ35895.1 addiction module toxin RelE [Prosthecochloris vibrioformis]